MGRLIRAYERFLRLPEDAQAETALRVRAIWMTGWLFVATQVLNLVVMSSNYKSWTYDHTISASCAVLVIVVAHLLRWYKAFWFYAVFFSALMLAGTLGSALPEHTGINSALVPFLALGPLINGYIAGRRAAVIFAVIGIATLSFLYWVSLSHEPTTVLGNYHRETNRFFQASFAIMMSTVISALLAERVYFALSTLRETAERAQAAEVAKSQFLATMSHELRTPLNGVIGLTDALLAGDLPSREKRIAGTIKDSGESLLLILNDLLDLSKIEAGKLAVDPRPCSPKDVIRAAVEPWEETALQNGLSFNVHVDEALPDAAELDDLRTRQIIHNLVSNALKFTAEGGVSVTASYITSKDRSDLLVRVTDSGKGVPDEVAELIFKPFEQGERGTTRRYGGTGLGLPICRLLSELMGGTIELVDTGPQGTTFELVLPITPLAPKAETGTPDAPIEKICTTGDLADLRVLVAEDNPINRLVVGEFLKRWGIKPVFAETGIECLDLLAEAPFDVVLMDKHMPKMSGIEATKALRASDAPYRDIPVIAVTADAMAGEQDVMLNAGVNAFLTKPLRAEDLHAVLCSVMGCGNQSCETDAADAASQSLTSRRPHAMA